MTQENKVSFEALIKQLTIKSLVSGDKEAEIKLRFIPTEEILNKLNKLHKADDFVRVVIHENRETGQAIKI